MRFKISQPLAIQQLGSRSNQEDSIFPSQGQATADDRLFILCDGMGGHESGEVASSTVCQTISNFILSHLKDDEPLSDEVFEDAVAAAYAAVDEQDSTGLKKMGTTLTFLCFHKGGCTAAHIGDSRIYHVRPATNEILYRSRDHSLVYDLFEVGEISREELKTAKNKNVITRVIMAHQERPSKADIVHITNIEPGDYFYLCSDGMLEQMEDRELMEIFCSDKSDEQKCNILIGETIDNSDNHSAYIIRIESVEREEGDSRFLDNEAAARAANKVLMAELNPSPTAPPPPLPEAEAESDDDVQVVMAEPVPQQPSPISQQPSPIPQESVAPTPQQSKKGKGIFFLMAAVFFFVVVAIIFIVFFLLSDNPKSNQTVIENTPTETTITRENIDDDDDDDRRITPQQQNQTTSPARRPSSPAPAPRVNTPSRNNSDPNKTNSSSPSNVKPQTIRPQSRPQTTKPQSGESSGGQQNGHQGSNDDDFKPNI